MANLNCKLGNNIVGTIGRFAGFKPPFFVFSEVILYSDLILLSSFFFFVIKYLKEKFIMQREDYLVKFDPFVSTENNELQNFREKYIGRFNHFGE